MTQEELRRMQLLELEMMGELDRICRKYNINYVIYGGTLLGAVRHNGFIPWDDDMDVAMLREDYNEFKKHIDELNSNICFFQDHDVEPEYIWGYGKLRHTGTEFIRKGQEHMKHRTGVSIDIEPMDDVPNNLILQILLDIELFFLRKILYSRVGKYSENMIYSIFYSILSLVPVEYSFKRLNRLAMRSRNNSSNPIRILSLPSLGKCYVKTNPFKDKFSWPKKWITERTEFEFEGMKLWGSKHYDQFLRYEYNDYMKLPPKEKRKPQLEASKYMF